MFGPGIMEIAEDLNTDVSTIVGAQSGFVIMLGIGPLIFAPLSETFGRRRLYMVCFSIFAVLQIPTALAVNVEMLIAVRTVAGFFGSKLSLISADLTVEPRQEAIDRIEFKLILTSRLQAWASQMEEAQSAICTYHQNGRASSAGTYLAHSSVRP